MKLILMFVSALVIFFSTTILADLNRDEDGYPTGKYTLLWMVANTFSVIAISIYIYEFYIREILL